MRKVGREMAMLTWQKWVRTAAVRVTVPAADGSLLSTYAKAGIYSYPVQVEVMQYTITVLFRHCTRLCRNTVAVWNGLSGAVFDKGLNFHRWTGPMLGMTVSTMFR